MINIIGEIDYHLYEKVIRKIKKIPPDEKWVDIILTTFGGDFGLGIAIHDMLKQLPLEINMYCYGEVYSSGMIILQAATNRISSKNCSFMFHEPSVSDDNYITNVENHVVFTQKVKDSIYHNIFVPRMKPSFKSAKACKDFLLGIKQDFYLTPEEAMSYGFIDSIA